MKILGLCLAILLGPPGGGALSAQNAAPRTDISTTIAAQAPAHADIRLELPTASKLPTLLESHSAGSIALSIGLTGFLILLSFYFYMISVELGREAMRRERIARKFVNRGRKAAVTLPPVQGYEVDQIESLLLPKDLLTAS